jgi:anti-repressor protein
MDLQLFSFNDQSVRVISVNGDPWFVAQDVCSILDLGNVSQACKPLKAREKDLYNNDTLGGKQDVVIISESGLYRLTMKSRKPQAEPFQDWVCEEILPSIRKTGKYEVVPSQPVLPQSFSEALRLLADQVDQNQKLTEANQVLQTEVGILEPKAERYDLVMDSDGWLTGEQIVKQLAIPKFSVRKLYDILRQEKVLFKRPNDGTNCPYATWVNEGLAKLRDGQCFDGVMRFSPVFSWKGLDRILDILREHQVIPKNKQYRFNFDSSKIVPMKRA